MLNKKIKQKYFIVVLFLSAICLLFFFKADSSGQLPSGFNQSGTYSSGELIFQYKFQSSFSKTSLQKISAIQQNGQLQKIQTLIGATSLRPLIHPDLLKGLKAVSPVDEFFIIDFDENLSFDYVRDLLTTVSRIVGVEPVKKYRLDLDVIPNDPEYGKQLHLPQISAPAAWEQTQGDSSIIIAIVDNGFDLTHPDLQANYWQNLQELNGQAGIDDDGNGFIDDIFGYDFAEDDADPGFVFSNLKENSHGTHIAGIAGAIGNNQIGVAGVSWKSKILPIKVFKDDDPLLTSSNYFLPGIVYAINQGAKIINLSWGNLGEPGSIEQEVMNLAYRNGVMIVGAAGNNNSNELHFPSAYFHVISVGAVQSNDQKSNFSNFGLSVDIMAPGDEIFSTFIENKYGFISGTSMAAPIVAGVAALIWAKNPDKTVDQVMQQLVTSADPIDIQNPGFADQLGNGRVNAFRALTENNVTKPKAKLVPDKFVMNDSIFGNNNRLIEKNETIAFFVSLTNYSLGDEPSLFVKMSTPGDLEIIWQTQSQTVLAPADSNFSLTEPFICTIPENFSKSFVKFIIELSGENVVVRKDTLIFQIGKYPVLIVDDDNGENNVEGYYTLPLQLRNIPYAVWHHQKFGTPDSNFLNDFALVIWFCEGASPSLTSQDRNAVINYLSEQGNLFLSGQDIGFDLADPASVNAGESSQNFYRNSLKADYISNDAEENRVFGMPGDVIGNEMDFYIFQPGLADNQSPDLFEPLDSANTIFRYNNFKGAGGIRFDGNYRLVYSGFGLEAVNSAISALPSDQIDSVRSRIYYRTLNYLHPLRHKPIYDQMTTNKAIHVSAEYLGPGDIPAIVTLHYKLPQDSDFNSKELQQAANTFAGELPLSNQFGDVYYYFEIQHPNYSWNLPVEGKIAPFSFRVGDDNKAPEIYFAESGNPFSLQPEYSVFAAIKDNSALDSSSLFLVFNTNRTEIDSSLMVYRPGFDRFEGKIAGDYFYGDTISYWIVVSDRANPPNYSQSKNSQFVIGLEKFETGLLNWNLSPNGWGLDSSEAHSGFYSINTSPYKNYSNNLDISITTKNPLDLSRSNTVELQFYTKYIIESGDKGMVEIKNGNEPWQKIAGPFSGFQGNWKLLRVDLSPFSGDQNCFLRFRFISDNVQTTALKGWSIDDVRIVQDHYITYANVENEKTIPIRFHLSRGFPNPFRDKIRFELNAPENIEVSVFIYNILGQKIKDISFKNAEENHTIFWDGTDGLGAKLPTGIYLVKAIFQDRNLVKKVVLIR